MYNSTYTLSYTLYYILYYIIWDCPTYPTHPYTMRFICMYIYMYIISYIKWDTHPTYTHHFTHPPTYSAACGRMRRTYTYMGTATYMLFPSGSQRSHSPSTEGRVISEKVPAVKF